MFIFSNNKRILRNVSLILYDKLINWIIIKIYMQIETW